MHCNCGPAGEKHTLILEGSDVVASVVHLRSHQIENFETALEALKMQREGEMITKLVYISC
jgi:hypothetical protein